MALTVNRYPGYLTDIDPEKIISSFVVTTGKSGMGDGC